MNNLKSIRKQHKLTQAEIAKILDCSAQAYQRYEKEEREADYATLRKLADYFNTSIDYLLGRTELNTSPIQWTEEEKAAGVGAHGTNLSNDEWEWLELRSAIIEAKGEKGLRAIQVIIQTYLDGK